MNKVQEAARGLQVAEKKLHLAIVRMFKPGMLTQYKLGAFWIPCEVIRIDYFDRIQVLGHPQTVERQGKVYWVHYSRFSGVAE